MKKEIVDLIIKELLKHKEEIIRLEIDDRVTYLGLLIQHISGVPAVYLPVQIAEEILSRVGKEIRLSRSGGLF
ncbi:MAG TPA: hypothetical protein VJA86_03095 [Candidatus Nanoarchaeia archaeon]|nr:hypothetical protein [Candidatus Nanoarchaeia archaeon]